MLVWISRPLSDMGLMVRGCIQGLIRFRYVACQDLRRELLIVCMPKAALGFSHFEIEHISVHSRR